MTAFPEPPTSRDDVAAYCLFYGDVIFVRARTPNGWQSVALTEIGDDEEIAALVDRWWDECQYPSRLLEAF
jgi:hypothetical protein